MVDARMAEKIDFFIDEGYVIFEGAVDQSLCDEIRKDVDRSISGELPLRHIEGFPGGGRAKERAVLDKENLSWGEAKLLDLHATSKNAQKAFFETDIKKFLEIIFEDEVLSFASLTFKHGSTQPVHQDSTYVKVDSPLKFAAAWLALEDIQPGSGELEYIPGSHKMEETLFNEKSKWFVPNTSEAENYSQNLYKKAEKLGLKSEFFLPKKGDVLIWSADLAHGGAQDADRSKTRWSIVSHFCPLSNNPMYFYARNFGRKIKSPFGGYFSSKESKEGEPTFK